MFVGHEAVRGWWSQLYDAFDDLRFDAIARNNNVTAVDLTVYVLCLKG